MKNIGVLVLVSSMFISGIVNAQTRVGIAGLVPYNNTYKSYRLKHHDWATHLGRVCLLTGAGTMVAGGTMAIIGVNTPKANNDQSRELLIDIGAAVTVAGAELALFGGITYLLGRRYERRHPDRYTLVTGANRLGLAMNF